MTTLRQYTAEHRFLLDAVARQAGIHDPVAVNLDEFAVPLLKASRRGELLPVDGVLVRDWDPDNRRTNLGALLGLRVYYLDDLRFVRVCFNYNPYLNYWAHYFYAVARRDYRRLYKAALGFRRDTAPPSTGPVLPAEQLDALWKNTIGYLEPDNLRRIKEYGGRPKRGVLLTGAPGNGKTMACRWLWEACLERGWEWRLVTPDDYRSAREGCNPVAEVQNLFTVEKRGVVFFDDMDIALRDRDTVKETDDQSIFLTALDGITLHEGVVFVFTTNCALSLIDPAFKRPGRLDVVLHFKAPDEALRRRLFGRWHADIRAALSEDRVVQSTEGYSFAEVEELKNLLIMHYLEAGTWDWDWAQEQFAVNRTELTRSRRVGFAPVNGHGQAAALVQATATDTPSPGFSGTQSRSAS